MTTISPEAQIAALSRGLNAADAGRRVGWAHAYSAEASKDELSRDLNMLREERDILYRYASFIHGAVLVLGNFTEMQRLLSRYSKHVGAVLDADVVRAGREGAQFAVKAADERTGRKADRLRKKAEQVIRQNRANREFKRARDVELQRLLKRFHIPNEAALFDYLEKYPT